MGLGIAIEELYSTGWSPGDGWGCETTPDGLEYPGFQRVVEEFESTGLSLCVERIEDFGCHVAIWRNAGGAEVGSAVGSDEAEAAVFALCRLRREFSGAVR